MKLYAVLSSLGGSLVAMTTNPDGWITIDQRGDSAGYDIVELLIDPVHLSTKRPLPLPEPDAEGSER